MYAFHTVPTSPAIEAKSELVVDFYPPSSLHRSRHHPNTFQALVYISTSLALLYQSIHIK